LVVGKTVVGCLVMVLVSPFELVDLDTQTVLPDGVTTGFLSITDFPPFELVLFSITTSPVGLTSVDEVSL